MSALVRSQEATLSHLGGRAAGGGSEGKATTRPPWWLAAAEEQRAYDLAHRRYKRASTEELNDLSESETSVSSSFKLCIGLTSRVLTFDMLITA